MLSFAGAVVGVLLAWAGIRWLQSLRPANVPRLGDIGIDWRVLLFYGGRVGSRRHACRHRAGDRHAAARSAANAGGRRARIAPASGTMWGRGGRLRRVLVVAEITFAVVLLVGAGLLIRTVGNLQRVSPGFDARRVLTFELTMTGQKYANGPRCSNAYRDLWERLEHVAGVESAGGITSLPLSGHMAWGPITVEGRVPPPGENFINADSDAAGQLFRNDAHSAGARPATSMTRTPRMRRVAIVDEIHGAGVVARTGPDRQAHPLRRPEFDLALANGRRRRRAG